MTDENRLSTHHKAFLTFLAEHHKMGAVAIGMRKPLPPAVYELIAAGCCKSVDVFTRDRPSTDVDVMVSLTTTGRTALAGHANVTAADSRR